MISDYMQMRLVVAMVFVVVIGGATCRDAAAVVAFDFDNGAGGPTQTGFLGLTTAGGTFASTSGAGGTVTLSLASNGGITSRDRGALDASQPLSDIGRDFVFGNRNAGATFLDVTVADLAPGAYTVTSFHHDRNGSSAFDIDVDVNTGGGFMDGATVSRSFGVNPAGGVASGSFDINATGSDVTLRLVASTNGHLINALTIVPTDIQPLNVDIGLNGHDIQPGFVSFERGSSAGNDDEVQTYFTPLGVNDTVTVTLDSANVFRDRTTTGNPVGGSLGDLAESFFARQGEVLLTLSDLEAGDYEITTFHHDSQTNHGGILLGLTDANGIVADLGLDIDPSFGTNPVQVFSNTIAFTANGFDDVVLRFFEGPNSPASIVINGFTLQANADIPEPTSLALISLAGAAMLRRHRRHA